ncbi:hypothetical protein ABI_44150 [Asticcacaulis biprosthecium C19]|uniref:Uncharacterized protein n=1 Tax=Asticcacaulis biprosthecium C19 TaxID=715226 RepID=F4QTB8_9CAUL|nr:hypothetical protein [Asticcacaulis biprosthecium]EGF89988.1 hypothetical protein ABI_44150 [Asticcacaulis biprosthecium C19]
MAETLNLRIAILHICEADEQDDARGVELACRFADAGHRLADLVVIPNKAQVASRQMAIWREAGDVDVVLTLPPKSSKFSAEKPDITLGGVCLRDGRLGEVHVIHLRSMQLSTAEA